MTKMQRHCRPCVLLSALLLIAACSKNPVQPVDELPQAPPDPFEQNRLLGRGINLGNALEAPNEGDWGVVLEEEYFDLIKQAGFQSVRIPIRWSAHTTRVPPYVIDTQFLRRVDWAVEQALSRGLAAIINVHHYEELMQEPAAHKARFLAIWGEVAAYFKDRPLMLFFELLNEPSYHLTPSLWNEYAREAIALVRESNPYRTILVSPGFWGNFRFLDQLVLPEHESNVIVSIHYYEPFEFTHQGAEWVAGSNAWLGTTWNGTVAEQQAIELAFRSAVNWATAQNRPLNLGEFGAYSKADMDSRVRWTAFVARTAEAFGMSWHYWEFISGFGAYDGQAGSWREPLLRALIPGVGKREGIRDFLATAP